MTRSTGAPASPLLSIDEACEYTRLARSVFYERLHEFDQVKLGRRQFVSQSVRRQVHQQEHKARARFACRRSRGAPVTFHRVGSYRRPASGCATPGGADGSASPRVAVSFDRNTFGHLAALAHARQQPIAALVRAARGGLAEGAQRHASKLFTTARRTA